jgi:hypothetical protein
MRGTRSDQLLGWPGRDRLVVSLLELSGTCGQLTVKSETSMLVVGPRRALLGCDPQSSLMSTFARIVSATDRTIDQTRHPGIKRTWVRSPARFQITNIGRPSPRGGEGAGR